MLIIFNKVVVKKIYHLKYFGGVNENYILFGKNCRVADLSSLINLFLLKQSKRTDLAGHVG